MRQCARIVKKNDTFNQITKASLTSLIEYKVHWRTLYSNGRKKKTLNRFTYQDSMETYLFDAELARQTALIRMLHKVIQYQKMYEKYPSILNARIMKLREQFEQQFESRRNNNGTEILY